MADFVGLLPDNLIAVIPLLCLPHLFYYILLYDCSTPFSSYLRPVMNQFLLSVFCFNFEISVMRTMANFAKESTFPYFSPILPLLYIVLQVLISGKEEPEAPLSPAMDAVIRVFKRVCGLSENEGDAKLSGAAGVAFLSIRFLVASTQAINLIGKQGSLIKSIQEGTGASVRVLPEGKLFIFVRTSEF